METGPNGDVGILTSTENGYLFAQECKTREGESGRFPAAELLLLRDIVVAGVVTEIYHGWTGGYPYHRAPLYGSQSNLPASSSFSKVVTDQGDPMCVH